MAQVTDQNTALAMANQEVVRNNMNPADFDIALDAAMSQGEYWMIWYDRKGQFRAPGGKHAVRINKATGEAVFMKGQ